MLAPHTPQVHWGSKPSPTLPRPGRGGLIFALPPAELAAHPTDGDGHHELTKEISDEGFGLMTALRLPGGSELALYEPSHPSPLSSDA